MKHNQKIKCINADNQKVLKLDQVYTVDTTFNAPDGRVLIQEWKRFSFSKDRFIILED